MIRVLASRNFLIFTVVVAAQGATGYYLNARKEYIPASRPLTSISQSLGNWTMATEWPIEPEVQEVLKANDTLSRHYVRPHDPNGAGLFIAFFLSQRAGVAPHSPKNCLPGNGWVAEKSSVISIPVPGYSTPVEANYYVVQRGDNKSVVVYWYQSHGRTVANEYRAKFFVIADAIRLNRTDTALVRVTVPAGQGENGTAEAERTAIDFVQQSYASISQALPQ